MAHVHDPRRARDRGYGQTGCSIATHFPALMQSAQPGFVASQWFAKNTPVSPKEIGTKYWNADSNVLFVTLIAAVEKNVFIPTFGVNPSPMMIWLRSTVTVLSVSNLTARPNQLM